MMIILFVLATIGMTNILVHSKILDDDHLGFRSWLCKKLGRFSDVLECYECTGFWCGLITGTLLLNWNSLMSIGFAFGVSIWHGVFTTLLLLISGLLILLGTAFAGAGLMHAYVNIMNLIESKIDFVIGEPDEPKGTK